jgi:hypothetical protein
LSGLTICSSSLYAQEPSADQVKAAFIYSFTKYVTWPDGVFQDETTPITIAILSDEKFAQIMTATVEGKSTRGRNLTVILLDDIHYDEQYNVLYTSECFADHCDDVINFTLHKPILTVCNADDFAESGGIIQFFKQGNKIRFAINKKAADKVGLVLSSKLLNLAKVINDD